MALAGLGIVASQGIYTEDIPERVAVLSLDSPTDIGIAFKKDAILNQAQLDFIAYIKDFCSIL